LCLLFCAPLGDANRRRRRRILRRRRRRWNPARAADNAARAAARAAAAAADRARRAAAAAAEAARRAANAAAKFVNDAFDGLVECATDLKKCILAMINAVFNGLGLPRPVSNPHGLKFCLRPHGICVSLPNPSLQKPPWQWGASLHCVDVLMMIQYWMDYVTAIFNMIMGALSWFLDKLCKFGNAVMDFLKKAFGLVAKVFEPVLSPVLKLFKPLTDSLNSVAKDSTSMFGNVFKFMNISVFLNLPSFTFPNWFNFTGIWQNWKLCSDGFETGLDSCGIKEIYDSLRAAFCALRNLDFDKFLKSIKSGVKAVVNFGKNIGKCFKVTTKGLEAVFDAFPFVKTWKQTNCAPTVLTGAIATVGYLIKVGFNTIKNALEGLMGKVKSLVGASSMRSHSNRSGGDRSDVVGFKAAFDVWATDNLSDACKSNWRCWFGSDSASLSTGHKKKLFGKAVTLGRVHRVVIGMNYFFRLVTATLASALLGVTGDINVVSFLVLKLVVVISKEGGVGTWNDLSFALYLGSVVACPLFSLAFDALKKASPFKAQDFALGLSWTGDFYSAKYGQKKGKRNKVNATFLQACSANPKLEFGYPSYPGQTFGLTFPVEFKPIWVWWVLAIDTFTFIWVLGTTPISDFQIEGDITVYGKISKSFSKNAKRAPSRSAKTSIASSGSTNDKDSASLKDQVKFYAKVFAKGMVKLAQSVVKEMKSIWASFVARSSIAFSFLGWVFSVCFTCFANTRR